MNYMHHLRTSLGIYPKCCQTTRVHPNPPFVQISDVFVPPFGGLPAVWSGVRCPSGNLSVLVSGKAFVCLLECFSGQLGGKSLRKGHVDITLSPTLGYPTPSQRDTSSKVWVKIEGRKKQLE